MRWPAPRTTGSAISARRRQTPVRRRDIAAAEHGLCAQGNAAGRAHFVGPRRVYSAGFVEDRYLNHPRYEPLWAELERLGITAAVHATPGLWNPEWTSHGPFFEKIKDRLAQLAVPGGGGGPFAGGAAASNTTFIRATPLGHPLAPILAPWLDNHMFVASTLIFPRHQSRA